MKIAIAGKGGVGKTTLASLLARSFSSDGMRVIAIDADPDANLAAAIGIDPDQREKLRPISEMKELAEERTAHGSGLGGFFKLNPTVDDLPESLSAKFETIRLLSLGSIRHGGAGCVCPQHTILRALMRHILLRQDDVVVMDMEAGVEHLGRGTADAVDVLIIVVEPGKRSLETASQIERLAADLGIKQLAYVGSKVRDEADSQFLVQSLPSSRYLGDLHLNDCVRQADQVSASPFDQTGPHLDEIKTIRANLEAFLADIQARN